MQALHVVTLVLFERGNNEKKKLLCWKTLKLMLCNSLLKT